MTNTEVERLYRRMLIELWHADDATLVRIVPEIAAEDLLIHQRGVTRSGSQQLITLVRQGRAPFRDVKVSLLDGPICESDRASARWQFEARYAGGIPQATAAIGRAVAFTGVDWIRVASGRVAEYWVYSDAEVLMAQLGVFSAGPTSGHER